MIYTDSTNKNGLLQRCEFWARMSDGEITGDATLKAQFTANLNAEADMMFTEALLSLDDVELDDKNHTKYPVFTRALVAGQKDYAFTISDRWLKMLRVDVTYDGVNYVRASRVNLNDMGDGIGSDTNESANYSTSAPVYDMKYNSLWIYPLATADEVTAGALVRVEVVRDIDPFTTSDTTQEPWMDRAFHELLAVRATYPWVVTNKSENGSLLSRMEKYIEDRNKLFKKHYGSKDLNGIITIGAVYQNYE